MIPALRANLVVGGDVLRNMHLMNPTSVAAICTLLVATAPADPPVAPAPPARPPVVVTTLQMDPESPREIVGWWVAPDGLVEVREDGGFRRWNSHDRLDRPAESGRWHRENHAVFWLEPYTLPKTPRRRAALWLRDDALMATIDGATAAFGHASSPPRIPADDLLGDWHGPGGHLVFRDDSTYVWTAAGDADGAPARIGAQRGRWRLDADRRLRLEPVLAGQRPVLTAVVRDDGETPDPGDDRIVELRSVDGAMRRPEVDPGTDAATIPVNPATPSTERQAESAD